MTAAPGGAGVVRIVIADDQPLIRQGFAMILGAQDDLRVVGEAGDGVAAIARVRDEQPDVVLMDIRMPVMDGIEATRRLSAEGAASRVLILTTFGHDEYVVGALAAGAAGFVLKDATPEELVHAVRVVAGGDALLSPAVTTRLIARVLPSLSTPDPSPTGAAALELLTDREREVLLLLAAGGSNAEIGEALFISETTVKTHISHLLTKLQLRDRVQAVIAAYEMGLLSPGSR
ncbi:MAG: response regulator transcription factor [Actinomycetota bacterium]|nr:response regulator transcription factor [Actinomycetota bacterium]MDA8342143.1 response regulator transcription factor [Actinomycetota bacterium]